MAYKLAVAISGAVSLGSYEAGAVYELLQLLKKHNESLDEKSQDQRIEIDVITGASAGGMTAAVIAQRLLYDADALEGETENSLYQAWVDKVDIRELLNKEYGDAPDKSLFSSNFIEGMADDLLMGRYKKGSKEAKKHVASAEQIHIGLAMSNLNGVDYAVDLSSENDPLNNPDQPHADPNKYTQTRFQDRFTTTLSNNSDEEIIWSKVKKAALGCGAFPLAFRPVEILRKWQSGDYQGLGALEFNENKFHYADGGIFNNYTLGMARELVSKVDTKPEDFLKRFYIYISPNSRISNINFKFEMEKANMVQTAKAVVGAIFHQGRFQDWMVEQTTNAFIDNLDDRAEGILDIVRKCSDEEIHAINTTSDIMLRPLYEKENAMTGHSESQENAFARLKADYSRDLKDEKLDDNRMKAWIQLVQIIEKCARLSDKERMNVYTITSEDDELAGEKLEMFLGFFDKKYRDYDYNVGRRKARKFLESLKTEIAKGGNHLPLGNLNGLPQIAEAREDLSGADIGHVGRGVRKSLYKRAKERTKLMLKSFGLNWLFREGIYLFAIRGRLKGFLQI